MSTNTDKDKTQNEQKTVYKGRSVIYTNYETVDETNVVEVVNESISFHRANVSQIQYLWDYYKGVQPILHREKDVRPQICNRIVENHAQEIVAFKIGYQLAEPLQYTCRSFETEDSETTNVAPKQELGANKQELGAKNDNPDEIRQNDDQSEDKPDQKQNPFEQKQNPFEQNQVNGFISQTDQTMGHLEDDSEYQKRLKDVNELNTLMFAEDKMSADRDLFEWMVICGVGYRMAEADKDEDAEDGGAPFEIYTLDPRNTFVVYSRAYHHKPVMAVWTGVDPIDDVPIYNVYTSTDYYRIKNDQVDPVESGPHSYGSIPIVEYRLNNARMGVFEPVLPLLDAINLLESNRLDGIEQTVQSLIKFINCDVDEDTFEAMLQLGAVKVSAPDGVKADVDTIRNDLDQTSTQVTKDDLYAAVINICGMPNRNGQSGSTSDTGAAVLLRDGWTLAESHAKGYELQFKRAERDFLRVILAICEQSKDTDIDLRVRDIELAFNRRNYENILVKSQVLTTMLSQNKIHPQLAFQSCGLFTDPDAAYLMSKKYNEENREQFMQNNPFTANLYTGQKTSIGSQTNVPGPDNGDNEDKKEFPRKA